MAGGGESYGRSLARAAGGALLFSVPLLMTMEMWWLGFYIDRFRLVLLLALNFALLVQLSYYAGFRESFSLREEVSDALAALAVAAVVTAAALAAFNTLRPDMSANEVVGKVALQSVPASIGAMVARKQLGQESRQPQRRASYAGELFLMAVGALFFSFNVAPTEEMVLLTYTMTYWHLLGLVLLSLVLLHAFVYTVGFAGKEEPADEAGFGRTFLTFTVAGYGIVLLVSLYMLWTFGRTDGASVGQIVGMTVVLGFPAAIGAAVARLIV